ncbi:MAG TPA: vWA domain-containing protein [Thermoanaerobaculia bacterium]|nr:vWA domain-containing protein [Thermoanaerobaculia bacterium]
MKIRRVSSSFFVLALAAAAAAMAQPQVSSAAARAAQFVFIIDDSGSMKTTDPDRLAIFAVQSLVSMLDDRDEVSVVRLDGPHDGVPPPAIEPLQRNRRQILDLLALDKSLAHYDAQNTRCRTALNAVQRLLNDAYRPEVSQVVIFLTDGACTPAAEEQPAVEELLQGLRSYKDGLFQFYLLLFPGERPSSGIFALASRSGGEAMEVGRGDPTAILHPFATALSRSQGYESYLLSPGKARLAAHRGAERVRLLAVAPGDGPPLTISVHDQKGNAPRTAGTPRTGVHRYEKGRVFRFAALDYRPDVEPVTVDVSGAGKDWKVVALPEYRLAVRMSFTQGTCDRPGPPARFGVDTGSTVCILSELVNGDGQVVGGDVTGGDLKTAVRVRRPDQPGAPPVELTANPLPGDRARFGLLRSDLPRGDYEFQPVVTLNLSSGDAVHLQGRPMLLAVSSIVIKPQPDRFDFGTLNPGDSVSRQVVLGGAFPPASGTLAQRDRGDLPACISAELGSVPEGKGQPVRVDQRYNLTLRVAPYCGPQPFRRSFDTMLRLAFETGAAERQLPVVELPVHFAVDYDVRAPRELTARVKAGEAMDLPLTVAGNFRRDVPLRAVVAGPGDPEGAWPKDASDLGLGFAAPGRKGILRDGKGAPRLVQDFVVGPAGGGEPLRLRAAPNRCCAAGTYRTQVGLVPAAEQFQPPGAPPLAPILVPVRVEVIPAGFWACYGPRLLAALAALLLLLLLLYAVNMVRNSSFLKPEALAAKLKPLVWTGYGDTVEQKNSSQEVLRLVRRGLPFNARARTWLQANPFRFGLPGGTYRETVELYLQPHRDVARSQVVLRVEPGLQERMAQQPELFAGRLFAMALGGVTILAVPDGGGRIARLAQQDVYAPATPEEAGKPKVAKLRRAKLLKHLEDWESYQEDAAAGWQVG